jgi:hypothetical protein
MSKFRRVVASHGLGNQLFQYCFAHYLTKSGDKIQIENNPIWSPGLNYSLANLKNSCSHIDFRVNPTVSHSALLGRIAFRTNIAIPISNLYMRYFNYDRYIEIPQNYFTFDQLLSDPIIKKTVYQGFWIHWEYVYSQRNSAVIDIFNYLETQTVSNKFLSKSHKNLVIHVRRGDFTERNNDQTFGIISAESYKKVIKDIKNKFDRINVITLTNDPNLKNNNLYGEDFGRILTPDFCDAWQALKLMSQADIVVSANSTLSWWGSVLATVNGGVGYIPNSFYKNIDTQNAFSFPNLLKYSNYHD